MNSCITGKVVHRSKDQAKQAIWAMGKKNLRPYMCPKCKFWHLTSEWKGEVFRRKRKWKS